MTILKRFKKRIRQLGSGLYRFKWWILGVIGVLLLLFSLLYPLDYYIEMPGGAYDIRSVLTVDKKKDDEKGSYNFVAVTVTQATLAKLLYACMTPYTEISPASKITGGYSNADYLRINEFYMQTSQNTASYQALTLAGKEAKLDYQGVYVLNVSKNSTFKGILNIADTVTGVNGITFKSSADLINYVADLDLGSKVTVQYTSNGKKKEAVGKIIELPNGKNGIGIGLVDHTTVSSNVAIDFDTSGVGGPSAGLMFTLDIYDQLANNHLRKGRKIAGTGTIEADGSVGDIGGASLKVISAAKAGATIFFVPNNPVSDENLKKDSHAQTNYEEALKAAKSINTDMKIVPVRTVQDAIDYLRNND